MSLGRFTLVWALVGCLFLAPDRAAIAAAITQCTAPTNVSPMAAKLPQTARAIRKGKELTIVAIGSSSTEGVGASDPAFAYPAVLAEELKSRWPWLTVTVVNKGIGGEDVEEMLARFGRDVLPYKPQLVIWQVGSNFALRSVDVDKFASIVRTGLKRLGAERMDVVLMDPQYAPVVVDKPIHKRIVSAVRGIGNDLGVAVFARFNVMRRWIASGQYQAEDILSRDQLHLNDLSYRCIARLLAESLDAAAQATPLPAEEGIPTPGPQSPPTDVVAGVK